MIIFEYDVVGNLLTATDSLTGTIARSYDALNRLVREVTPQGAITEKGTGHLLKANALICLVRDSKSWRSVRQVEMP
ncbi:MAG: RHS repeat domain-containing protein [Candidatus Methylomirabilota bacterium]|jgi:YD repeat-containing protein